MILQALTDYYNRKAAVPDSNIAPPGWEWKEIPFLVVINDNGEFVRIEDTRTFIEKKQKTKTFLVPHTLGRTSTQIVPNLLWDNLEYALGIARKDTPDKEKKEKEKEEKKKAHVEKQHKSFLEKLTHYADIPAIATLIKCLQTTDWNTCLQKIDEKIKTELNTNPFITFKLQNSNVPICQNPEFVKRFNQATQSLTSTLQRCLISGEMDNIEILHPAIKGVQGTNSTGGKIVSFNFPAVESFGKEQGCNAAIGKRVAFAYTTALNALLGKESQQKMSIGDATIVWWAGKENEQLEQDLLDFFVDPPKDNPDRNSRAIERLYRSVNTGAFATDSDATRFYILGLAPNAGRISIRFWKIGTVAELSSHFRQYFNDLEIIRKPNERKHLSLWLLLKSTAALGESKNIAPNLAGEIMRSILTGTPFPITLLQAVIRRNVVERKVTYARAKLIKGCLNRKLKHNNPNNEKELLVSLDLENTNIGYLLGRLFAVLEKIQSDAHPGINATIRDKFYATASAAPVAVFANLMRLKNHHLAKLCDGSRVMYERKIREIMEKLPTQFPAHLSLDDQGRFAIGYYHQNNDLWTSKKKPAAETSESESEQA